MQIFRARTKAQLQEILAQYGWQNATESCWECDGQTLELDPEQLGRGHIQTRRVDEGQGISFIEVTVTAPATCQRCGHIWVPRLEPKSCPKCKTYYWNKPRKALERKERTMEKRHILDIPVTLECGCQTTWHEGETLAVGVYAWCEEHGDSSVTAVNHPAWEA